MRIFANREIRRLFPAAGGDYGRLPAAVPGRRGVEPPKTLPAVAAAFPGGFLLRHGGLRLVFPPAGQNHGSRRGGNGGRPLRRPGRPDRLRRGGGALSPLPRGEHPVRSAQRPRCQRAEGKKLSETDHLWHLPPAENPAGCPAGVQRPASGGRRRHCQPSGNLSPFPNRSWTVWTPWSKTC